MFQEQKPAETPQIRNTQDQARAFVRFDTIHDITIDTVERQERSLASFDSALADVYTLQGYAELPRSKEEARAAGVSGWNGQAVSATSIENHDGSVHLSLQAAPYFISRAMRDATQSGVIAPEDQWEASPKLLNVSALVIAPYKGQYHLFGQVKGNALGSGQVHAALAAGGVDVKALQEEDPLRAALNTELLEEMGLEAGDLAVSPFGMMIDESSQGMVNFVALAGHARGEDIVEAYRAHVADRLSQEKDPEVRALAAMSIPAGLALQPLEGGMSLDKVRVITALDEQQEQRVVRPYTDAIASIFQQTDRCRAYIERAGF